MLSTTRRERALGDRIVVLADGRVQQVGRPIDVYRRPANRFVAGFLRTPTMNFVEGRLRTDGERISFVSDHVRLQISEPTEPSDGPVTLGLRTEDLAVEGASEDSACPGVVRLAGEVVLVERLGGATHVHVDVGPHRIVASSTRALDVDCGDPVQLLAPAGHVHLFDGDGRRLI